jgi:hypothetical protein
MKLTYGEIIALSLDELRVKCAELEGNKHVYVDYENPIHYMRLMEKIWEKDFEACIDGGGVAWGYKGLGEFENYIPCNVKGDNLGEAIMRAFILIC